MPAKENTNINNMEPEIYDRQMRLWVLDDQKQFLKSRVLVIGMNSLGCQVAKNLVLAGVKALTILHHKDVTSRDGANQFLAPMYDEGRNTPNKQLEEVKKGPVDGGKNEMDLLKKFDIVIATNCEKDQLIKINNMCRKKESIMFLSATTAVSVSRQTKKNQIQNSNDRNKKDLLKIRKKNKRRCPKSISKKQLQ